MLKRDLSNVIENHQNILSYGTHQENSPIWVCWWTGESNAPELVKKCICSIKKNAGNHPVYLITQDNYEDYIEIPQYMLKYIRNNTMGLAHLSDYIRVSLLYMYGGLWLDATIFCSQAIPEEYFECSFFTCKSGIVECRFISLMRWTTFVFGGWKGNAVYGYLKEALEQYWQLHSTAVDYLFFDHLIELGYEQLPAVKKLIDSVPINNLRRDDLQAAMNRAATPDEWDDIVQSDTVLYKLSWRERYSLTTSDGQDSIYAHFLKRKM